MSLSGRQIAKRGGDGTIELRSEPLRCRLKFSAIPCGDGHALEINFAFSVQALDAKVERKMLAEMFLSGRDIATADEIAEHFEPALRESARRSAAALKADECVTGASNSVLLQALRESANAIAFNCGVEVLPPFDLSIDSPTLRREKAEAMTRAASERRAAGQVQHIQRSAELLRQFESLRQAAPELSPGKLLDRINEADRGPMFQTLLQSSAERNNKRLWIVAGTALMQVDLRADQPRPTLLELPSRLGPFRSIRPGQLNGVGGLLIGAQGGVVFFDPQKPAEMIEFPAATMTSSLGFNSSAAIGNRIWASHSEVGVVYWYGDDPQQPAEILPRSIGAKCLTAIDGGRVMFAVGGQAFVTPFVAPARALAAQSSSSIVHITAGGGQIILVRTDGSVETFDADSLEPLATARRCGSISAAGALPWLGSQRLLLADEDGAICCVGIDDALMTQYASRHQGLRALAACEDVIAAITADRQRIVFWKSWDPQPAGELHLASLARHRAGDLCFA